MKIAKRLQQGFTLIELLVVIAVLGVLAAGVLVGIDPVDRINSGNDSRVQNDVGTMGRASEAYAASNNGLYPPTSGALVTNGDLKVVPTKPSGYVDYVYTVLPTGCDNLTQATNCAQVWVYGQLKSKKFGTGSYWRYGSDNGKSCKVTSSSDVTTVCP